MGAQPISFGKKCLDFMDSHREECPDDAVDTLVNVITIVNSGEFGRPSGGPLIFCAIEFGTG